jgi:hypothetical protein
VSEILYPWGKHKGKPLRCIPCQFFEWLRSDKGIPEEEFEPEVAAAIRTEYQMRKCGSPNRVPPEPFEPPPRPQETLRDEVLREVIAERDAALRALSTARLEARLAELKLAKSNGESLPKADLKDRAKQWMRHMTQRFHPDQGGTNEQQVVVNLAYEKLKEVLGID